MYKEFCTGCGLCAAVDGAEFEKTSAGFSELLTEKGHEAFLKQVCPCSGVQCKNMEPAIWGRPKEMYLAWAFDPVVRHEASSGGVLTALCDYLLHTGTVDGVVHTGASDTDPISTETFVDRTAADVLSHCGSRYSASTPLTGIASLLGDGNRYVYVGKPCEITALRNFSRIDARVDQTFPYMLSFFCAGAPSEKANLALLEKMGTDRDHCTSLRYRGNGWPGYATAVDAENHSYSVDYRTAWRDTLGRDVRRACRFCLDGIGELADLSACDAWYLGDDGKPVFQEAQGRNAVFCRTDKGLSLFREALDAGCIIGEKYDYLKEIEHSQNYQFQRRATMSSALTAMKLLGREVPGYSKDLLHSYKKDSSFKMQLSVFRGTMKRIFSGKI